MFFNYAEMYVAYCSIYTLQCMVGHLNNKHTTNILIHQLLAQLWQDSKLAHLTNLFPKPHVLVSSKLQYSLSTTKYSVFPGDCTVVQCSLYSVFSTYFTVYNASSVHYQVYSVHDTVCPVWSFHYILYLVSSIHYTLYSVYSVSSVRFTAFPVCNTTAVLGSD